MRIDVGRIAWAGLAGWLALVALQHATSDLDASQRFVSEYARGNAGWVQELAFALWAASLAATAVLRRSWLVSPALAIAAIGSVMCAAFTTETVGGELPPGVQRTDEGRLHDLGSALIALPLILVAVLYPLADRARPVVLATLGLLAVLLLAPAALVIAGWDAPGVGQRAIILVGCGWQALAISRAGARSGGGA